MRTPEDPCRDPASEARDDHASEPRATPETDYAAWGETDVVEASFARRLERQRDELTDRWEKSANAFLIEQGKRESAERQRDGLLEAMERIAPRTSDKWARDACEDAIAAVKGGRDE